MRCINDTPSHKKAFYSVLKPELKKLRLSPIMHFLRDNNTSEVLSNTKPLDYIRHEHLESLFNEAENEEDILVSDNINSSLVRCYTILWVKHRSVNHLDKQCTNLRQRHYAN